MDNEIELRRAVLALDAGTPVEAVADIMGRVDAFLRRAKEVKAHLEDVLVARIEQAGPIEVNGIRYYAGIRKVTTCTDQPAAVESLLAAVAGDLSAFADCLAAGALKHGAARAVLPPDEFARLFRVDERAELREGKPVKRLMSVNTNFTPEAE